MEAVKVETINKGEFVKISYTAKLEDGTIIDSTDEEVAKEAGLSDRARYGDIVIVVGERHVIEGLDDALEGKEVGFKGTIEVEPEKAFGKYDPENKDVITLTKLKEKPVPGQRIQVGDRYGTVERIIGRRAVIDFNHPYAGKKIVFDVEIKEKIEEPVEKIKALFLLHTAKEVEAKIEDGKVIVEVPRGASFDQFFILGKFRALDGIFKHFDDIKEVEFVERYPRPETAKEVEAKETEEGKEAGELEVEKARTEKAEKAEETEEAEVAEAGAEKAEKAGEAKKVEEAKKAKKPKKAKKSEKAEKAEEMEKTEKVKEEKSEKQKTQKKGKTGKTGKKRTSKAKKKES
ncbi:peptidylprolyl isomerase [Archaeoglobales archaeon]|nr:MAG: peptidylprolyl isomerase [Archaeoglobales archaeon]